MVTTIYYNGKKLKTLLEDTALNSNKIHEGGVFVLGQESVSTHFISDWYMLAWKYTLSYSKSLTCCLSKM